MTTIREHDQAGTGGAIAARLTSEQVWRALTRMRSPAAARARVPVGRDSAGGHAGPPL
ncbi:MAG TPA: hypothetical protein VLL69_15760 [Streptosporangiaceae bacterium]|nr:hypothetical protein [Streptosporangiaceae bacterium]